MEFSTVPIVRRRWDIFRSGCPEYEKEGAMALFADLPGWWRPNISHVNIGGEKPTFQDRSAVDQQYGDLG
jgi:hypothetical protein